MTTRRAHRIAKRSEDGLLDGIYVVGELAGFDLELPTSLWPVAVGATERDRILDLEAKLNAMIDTTLDAAGVSQRVRVHFRRLEPLDWDIGVFSDVGQITAEWWL